DEVKLIGGFQTNKIGDLALNTVPRAGAIWTPTNPIGVNALYGQAFRAPSLDENLLNHPVIKGNPDLLPGTVGTFNVGIGCQRNRFQIGVDYFHSKQSNLITDIPSIPDIVPFHYVNVGEIAFHGAELEGKYYFGKDFFVQGSFLYQTNEDGNGNANVSPVPDFGFKAGMSYENRRGLTLSLFDVSGGPINGAAYTQDIDPGPGWHHVINAHLRYDFSKYLPPTAKYGVALAAHANNPINREVWLPSGLYSTAWTASRLSRGVSFTWGLNSPRAGSGRPTSEETPCAHD
ncbi:MAG: TonB-dependent receptor, partial [Bryobacteraceae bacterium]